MMYLSIYDISGIQSFIFATGKLKEQIGGSKIIHRILYQLLPEILGDKMADDWMLPTYPIDDFSESRKYGNIIYIGGGNAVVLFNSEESMITVTRTLQKKVLELSGGYLRLCHAHCTIDDLDTCAIPYCDIQKKIMGNLDIYKRTVPPIYTSRGFSFGADDNETLEPITLIDGKEYGAISRYQKRMVFAKDNSQFIHSKFEFAKSFEEFREKDKKSFVAVVHIDGNTMGKKILEFSYHLKDNNFSLRKSLLEVRNLSSEINSLYHSTLLESVNKTFETYAARGVIPFRPIVLDGDDVTVIIQAKFAFDFIKHFMAVLSTESKNQEKYSILNEQDFHPSAGAGIAYIHDKFPFYTAYNIAEELCKSAKKRAREVNMPANSSVDFQIIHSGISTSVEDFRKQNYVFHKKDVKFQLHIRPYLFDCDKSLPYSFDNFMELKDELLKPESKLPRSKLKALRNAYGQSVLAAETVGKFICTHQSDSPIAAKLATPFSEQTANYYDVLDVMDF